MGGMVYTQVGDIRTKAAKLAMGSMVLTLRDDVTGCEFMEKTKADSFKLMDDALELGYNTYDTAIIYAAGESELCLGEWMKSRGVRKDIFIVGKGGARNIHLRRFSPEAMMRDIFVSMDKMQVDYIDVYLTHHDNIDVPVEEIVDMFAYMHGKGYILGYGGSNWSTLARTKRAMEYAAQKGYPPFVAMQPGFSLAEPVISSWSEREENLNNPLMRENLDYYLETGMTLFTWSSMARGFWSGVFDRETFPAYRDAWDKTCVKSFCHEVNFKRMDRVKEYGARIGASVPNIALAWLLSHPGDVHPIIGANSRAELQSNLAALDIKMDKGVIDWLNLQTDERPW